MVRHAAFLQDGVLRPAAARYGSQHHCHGCDRHPGLVAGCPEGAYRSVRASACWQTRRWRHAGRHALLTALTADVPLLCDWQARSGRESRKRSLTGWTGPGSAAAAAADLAAASRAALRRQPAQPRSSSHVRLARRMAQTALTRAKRTEERRAPHRAQAVAGWPPPAHCCGPS